MAEPASIVVTRRIEWADTDASGVYHNTVPFRLAEQAEVRLLDRLGMLDEIYGLLPRVHMSVDLTKPLRFNDKVHVSLRVSEVGKTSVAYEFEIRRDGEVCASGLMVAVLLGGANKRAKWSDDHRRLLTSAGPQPGD